MKCNIPVALSMLVAMSVASSSNAVELTAITLFATHNEQGDVNPAGRWNSGPKGDGVWDVFVRRGLANDEDAATKPWLNNSNHTVKIPLSEGKQTFTIHFDSTSVFPLFGLNLFFDDDHARPRISAVAKLDTDGKPFDKPRVATSQTTMGWPLTTIKAAGTLVDTTGGNGIWWTGKPEDDAHRIELTQFWVATPEVSGSKDVVGSEVHEASGDGDYVAQITLDIKRVVPRPSDLETWLYNTAQVNILPKQESDRLRVLLSDMAVSPPFSFVYGGRPAEDLISDWAVSIDHESLSGQRARHTYTLTDPDTGLEVRWVGIDYGDYNVVEWTVYFKNTGTEKTPILSDIQALNVQFNRRPTDQFLLRHWRGTTVSAADFEPLATPLADENSIMFSPPGGRPTGVVWPYYNLDVGNEGVIIAVSWAGQWETHFAADGQQQLQATAGQKTTHMSLNPGEEIRTPLIAMLFWSGGDWIDAQNTWRRWMIDHNLPRPGGKQLPLPQLAACSSHQFAEMVKASERNQKEFIDSYLQKGLKLDYWWMDAGWYVGAEEHGWPWVGTWEVDRQPHRFPNGLRAISDHAHNKGVNIIVWFEPERVAGGTWLAEKHPEWVLGGASGGVLNLGNPEAWQWLTNHVDKIITGEGVDLYRQDYNINPLPFWAGNDAPDRQGMTENKYVTGYLAYWDELLKRHPGMLIDSCASGGHRNELETMRRAVPLLRSDYLFEPVGQQGHTYGLSFWLPFHGTGYTPSNTVGWGWGTGGISYDSYTRRSNMCPHNTGCFDFRVEVDDDLIQRLYQEWLEIGPDYFGDYYPLTDHTLSEKDWMAWQFYRPKAGEGFVQAFRRRDCVYRSAEFALRGLDAEATYVLTDDVQGQRDVAGGQLMTRGIKVEIPDKPGAVTIKMRKK